MGAAASSLSLESQLCGLIKEYGLEAVQKCLHEISISICNNKSASTAITTTTTTTTNTRSLLAIDVMEASLDAILIVNLNGTLRMANSAARVLFGLPPVVTRDDDGDGDKNPGEDLLSLDINLSKLIGGNKSEHHYLHLETATPHAIKKKLGRMRDVKGKRYDTSVEFPAQVKVEMIPEAACFVAVCHSLKREKQQEKLLEKEIRFVNSIMDSSLDAIIVANKQGTILQVTAATLQLFGYNTKEELVGKSVDVLASSAFAHHADTYIPEFFQKGTLATHKMAKRRDLTARRKDGTEFPCRIGVQNVLGRGNGTEDEENEVMVGFLQDISAEKSAFRLEVEKQAADQLLHNMLPREIVHRLKKDPTHIADHFGHASILFADIVGFTRMSNSLTAIQVVQFLNSIFSKFDENLDKYGLNKVKTIGDCYMVTSIPTLTDRGKSCTSVCHFAMDMIECLNDYNKQNPNAQLNMRIGVNTGPVVAGVVGTRRFLYDIWGDAVNIASRMESTGLPGKVQVTKAVVDAVSADCSDDGANQNEFTFEKRGHVQVKGIGEMETWLLVKRTMPKARARWKKLQSSVMDEKRHREWNLQDLLRSSTLTGSSSSVSLYRDTRDTIVSRSTDSVVGEGEGATSTALLSRTGATSDDDDK